jgi:hypothetical protein
MTPAAWLVTATLVTFAVFVGATPLGEFLENGYAQAVGRAYCAFDSDPAMFDCAF